MTNHHYLDDRTLALAESVWGDYGAAVEAAQATGNPIETARAAKQYATMILAKLDVPGDTDLHEAVFRHAFARAGLAYDSATATQLPPVDMEESD